MSKFAKQTDQELLRKYLETGSEIPFTGLVERYADLVNGVAARNLDNLSNTSDIGQLTFSELARCAPKLLKRKDLAGWLYHTACRKAWNLNRSERRVQTLHKNLKDEMMNTDRDSQQLWGRISPILDQTLARLSTADREVLIKRYFMGYSTKELAEQLSISTAAIEKRLQRAMERLRVRLGCRDGISLSVLSAALLSGVTDKSYAATEAHISLWSHSGTVRTEGNGVRMSEGKLSSMITYKTLAYVASVTAIAAFASLWAVDHFKKRESGSSIEQVNHLPEEMVGHRHTNAKSDKRPASVNIKGQVICRGTGEPLADAYIRFHRGSPAVPESAYTLKQPLSTLKAKTNENGYYHLPVWGIHKPTKMSIQVSREGYSSDLMEIDIVRAGNINQDLQDPDYITWGVHKSLVDKGDEWEVNFAMARERKVTGVVRDSRGNPVEGAELTCMYQSGNRGSGSTYKTNSAGNFSFPMALLEHTNGTFELSVTHPKYQQLEIQNLENFSKEELDSMKLVLKDFDSFQGVVLNSSGRPVANARVALQRVFGSFARKTVTTEEDGSFNLPLLSPGNYHVEAFDSKTLAFFSSDLLIDAPDQMVTLKLNAIQEIEMNKIDFHGLALYSLPPHLTRSFAHAQRGGFLIWEMEEKTQWRQNLVGNLILGAVPYDSPNSSPLLQGNPFGVVIDPFEEKSRMDASVKTFSKFEDEIQRHLKVFPDGSGIAKMVVATPDGLSIKIIDLVLHHLDVEKIKNP